jgi:gas vesicle protein
MEAFIFGLLLGVAIGAVTMIFVARNNRAKVERVLIKADKYDEKYKNYMTEWSDDIKKENKS